MPNRVRNLAAASALLLIAAQLMAAQLHFGVIRDPDGYSNVRKGPGTDYLIVDTFTEGEEFVYVPQDTSAWWRVYTFNRDKLGRRLLGYLHNSRIKRIAMPPSLRNFTDRDRQILSSQLCPGAAPAGIAKADLQYGTVKVLLKEYHPHDGAPNFYIFEEPDKPFEYTVQGESQKAYLFRWEGYPFWYKPVSTEWAAVYNSLDTVFVGYGHTELIKPSSQDAGKYYISYRDSHGRELGFMGSCSPGWDSYYMVPDSAGNDWLTAYKVQVYNSDSTGTYICQELVREGTVPVDNLPVIKCPCLLYKSMDEYCRTGIDLLRSYFQRLPVFTDSNSITSNRVSSFLPPYYEPIPYQPLFGERFLANTIDILNANYGRYRYYPEDLDINRISFRVGEGEEKYNLIYYPSMATCLMARRDFPNVEFPELDLGEGIAGDIRRIFNLDEAAILREYGEPVFRNDDVMIYITQPQRQLYKKIGSRMMDRALSGKISKDVNGLVFFELENDRVVVAGSTVFSPSFVPMMFY